MAQLIRRAKEGARYVRDLDRTQDGRPIFKSQNYNPLKTRGAIRILKIFYGPPEEVGIHCEFIAGTVLDYDERQSCVPPIKFEPYDALSWCWGTQAEDSWISIRKNGTQYAKSVRPELVSALRALRHPVYDRTLWVDAVCIDQSNYEERNHQVEMMAEIYSKADFVRIWLGDPTESSTLAIRFIKNEVLQLQHFDELCESVEASVKWRSLLELMQRPWFSRRWVVQEVALAKRAIIHCGSAKLSWTKFALAVELFVEVETATHRLSEVMKKDPSYWHVPMWFEYVSSLGASLLVDATGRLFRSEAPQRISNSRSPRPEARVCEIPSFSEDGDKVHYESEDDEPLSPEDRLWQRELDEQAHHIAPKAQSLLDLEYLVSSLAVTNTSKPHDTIYALLAIAKDTIPTAAAKEPQVRDYIQASLMKLTQRQRKQYIIDYHAPYAEVCQYFIQWSIDRTSQTDPSRALDILCRPWAFDSQKAREGSSEPALPSWIPQLSKAAYVMDTQPGMHGMKIGRKNADPLVGAPSITQRNYTAAETKGLDRKTFRFRRRRTYTNDVELDSFSMYVKGFVLDTITTVSSSSQNGAVPSEWAELVGWDHTTSDPPEHFWRTLVADRGKDGRNPPVYYSRACQESFRKGSFQSGTVDTSGLINNERNSVVAQFCRRVQAVIWNRCLVKTSSSKLGLVPKGTQPGDAICILYGCSVPVVLRQQEPKSPEVVEREIGWELQHLASRLGTAFRNYVARTKLFSEKRMADSEVYMRWMNQRRDEWKADILWAKSWAKTLEELLLIHEFNKWVIHQTAQSDITLKHAQVIQQGVEEWLKSSRRPQRTDMAESLSAFENDRAWQEHYKANFGAFKKLDDYKMFKIWLRECGKPSAYPDEWRQSREDWLCGEDAEQWRASWRAEHSMDLCVDSFRAWLREKGKFFGAPELVKRKKTWEKDAAWRTSWRALHAKSSEQEEFEAWASECSPSNETQFPQSEASNEWDQFENFRKTWRPGPGKNTPKDLLIAWSAEQKRRAEQERIADQLRSSGARRDTTIEESFIEMWRETWKPPVVDWYEFGLALSYGRRWMCIVKRSTEDNSGRPIPSRSSADKRESRQWQRARGWDKLRKQQLEAIDEKDSDLDGAKLELSGAAAWHDRGGSSTVQTDPDSLISTAGHTKRHVEAQNDRKVSAQKVVGPGIPSNNRLSSSKWAAPINTGLKRYKEAVEPEEAKLWKKPRMDLLPQQLGENVSKMGDLTYYDPKLWVQSFEEIRASIMNTPVQSKKDLHSRFMRLRDQAPGDEFERRQDVIDSRLYRWKHDTPRFLGKDRKTWYWDCGRSLWDIKGKKRKRLTVEEAEKYELAIKAKFRASQGNDARLSYQMLGEAYLHGMMDGEAMAYQNHSAIPATIFEIL